MNFDVNVINSFLFIFYMLLGDIAEKRSRLLPVNTVISLHTTSEGLEPTTF